MKFLRDLVWTWRRGAFASYDEPLDFVMHVGPYEIVFDEPSGLTIEQTLLRDVALGAAPQWELSNLLRGYHFDSRDL